VSGQNDGMLVSDAERDAALKILGDNAAVGRLSLDELEDRCDRALTVRTRGELSALTKDLPKDAGLLPSPAAALAEARRTIRRTVAIAGAASRRGRFRVAGSLSAVAVMGGDNIDLREAEIDGGELAIRVCSVLGVVNVYVPDTMEVQLGGFSILGANNQTGRHRPRQAKAPLIRVHGFNLIGRTNIFRVPVQALTLELGQARHLSVRAEHRHSPAAASSRRRRHGRYRHQQSNQWHRTGY
jgi:Domain of unknown function (DUF1707)/Cell wall-active antibiotics response 4TMS YvqF